MTTDTPRGPAAYLPDFAEKARYLCKLGMTDDELAAELRIPLALLLEWQDAIPEFADALWAGRTLGDGKVADGLYRRAVGANHEAVRIFWPAGADKAVEVPYTRHYPPETPACTWWLKNRRPQNWRDKIEIEAVRNGDGDTYSDRELEDIVAKDGGPAPAVPKGRTQ